jgi:rhamnogalacturonyl hydrolase YesR
VPAGEDRRHYVNESQDVQQYHYNGGMAAAFLVQLFLSTGDQSWLDLARLYQAFSIGSTEHQFEVMQVCKSAWGSGLLYAVTKEPIYRDWTIRMGDWFVAHQREDGHWENTPYLVPQPSLPSNLAITAEFIVHLDTIIGALSGGPVR